MLPPLLTHQLEQALIDLRYGSVQLIVHESKIVRIERIEKIRLSGSPEADQSLERRPSTSQEACREPMEG